MAAPMLVVADGLHANRVSGVVSEYRAKNPGAPLLLAASAILRILAADADQRMLRVGILVAEAGVCEAKLSAIGDVRLWRRRGRSMERFCPAPGAELSQDAVGLPGSRVQHVRVPLSPGDRLVLGSRALGELSALELYAVLSSPRGPAAAASALLEQLRPGAQQWGAAVGVLWADPQR